MKPQNVEPDSKKATKSVPSTVYCDNHPDREAVRVTDGVAFQVLHLCGDCVPADWPTDK